MSAVAPVEPLSTGPASRPRSLTHKTAWSSLASLTSIASFAVCNIVIARLLGPAGTGETAYALWLSTTAITLFALGMPQTITRFLAELEGAGRAGDAAQVGRWLVRRGYLGLLFGIAAVLGVEWSRGTSRPDAPTLALVAALFLTQGAGVLHTAVLAGRQQFRTTSALNLVASVLQLSAIITGSVFAGLRGALAGYVAGALVLAVAGVRFALGPIQRPEPAIWRRIRGYSFHVWAAMSVSLVLWSRTEVFFIERWWGRHEVAMFTIGLTVAQLATQGPLLLGSALVPHFAELYGAGDEARIASTYRALTRVIAFLVFPLCFVTAAASPILVPLLFGAAFAPAISNAAILIAVSAIGAVGSISSSLTQATERARFIAISGSLGAVVGLIAFSVAIPTWGAAGAAWTRAGLQIVLVAWGLWYVTTAIRARAPLRELFGIAVSAGVASAPAALVSLTKLGVPGLCAALPPTIALYLVGLRITRSIDRGDLVSLERIAKRLPAPAARILTVTVRLVSRERD